MLSGNSQNALLVAAAATVAGCSMKLLPLAAYAYICISVLFIGLARYLGGRSVRCIGMDEQLCVQRFTRACVHNGPAVVFLNPFGYRTAEVRKAETLGPMEYVKVQNAEGAERIECGPRLLFLEPHEHVVHRGKGISLTNTDYILVEDKLSGKKRIVSGPCVWFPQAHEDAHRGCCVTMGKTEYIIVENRLTGDLSTVRGPRVWTPGPYDKGSDKRTAIALQEDEYIRVKDASSGQRWIEAGKALVFLEPTWRVEGADSKNPGVRKAWVLKANEYVRLLNRATGKVTVHRGEKTVFPGPDEELLDGDKCVAIDLKVHEYVKLIDRCSGKIRVAAGPSQVFLGAGEEVLDGGKKVAVAVDDEHAALVRDKSSGQLRLVTEPQLFVPGPDEVIEEVRELIKLADHEAVIVKDRNGVCKCFYGSDDRRASDQPRSFFLLPHSEIVKHWWSRGPRRERKDVSFERVEVRPHFMKFEFNCRTSDNVELILEGVFFWELVDLLKLIRMTGDASGDICYHIRSQFTLHVARVTLKEFMHQLHSIAKEVLQDDIEFYETRGIKIHALEVTRYQCADKSTSEILEQIIQETTNRLNRISQAESENEVNIFRMQGQIEQSKLNAELLEIQHEQTKAEAKVSGNAEADRVAAFVDGLQDSVPKLEDRMKLWQTLRKTEALSVVSTGGASLYYTPNDVDLSIESRGPSPAATK